MERVTYFRRVPLPQLRERVLQQRQISRLRARIGQQRIGQSIFGTRSRQGQALLDRLSQLVGLHQQQAVVVLQKWFQRLVSQAVGVEIRPQPKDQVHAFGFRRSQKRIDVTSLAPVRAPA